MARKAKPKTTKRKYTRRAVTSAPGAAPNAKTRQAVDTEALTPEHRQREEAFLYCRRLVSDAGHGHSDERRTALNAGWAELGKQVAEHGTINLDVLSTTFDTMLSPYTGRLLRLLPTSHDLSR